MTLQISPDSNRRHGAPEPEVTSNTKQQLGDSTTNSLEVVMDMRLNDTMAQKRRAHIS
jgi:hypothetical protein